MVWPPLISSSFAGDVLFGSFVLLEAVGAAPMIDTTWCAACAASAAPPGGAKPVAAVAAARCCCLPQKSFLLDCCGGVRLLLDDDDRKSQEAPQESGRLMLLVAGGPKQHKHPATQLHATRASNALPWPCRPGAESSAGVGATTAASTKSRMSTNARENACVRRVPEPLLAPASPEKKRKQKEDDTTPGGPPAQSALPPTMSASLRRYSPVSAWCRHTIPATTGNSEHDASTLRVWGARRETAGREGKVETVPLGSSLRQSSVDLAAVPKPSGTSFMLKQTTPAYLQGAAAAEWA